MAITPRDPGLWTSAQVAAFLGITPTAVQALTKRGTLLSVKLGRDYLYIPKDVKNLSASESYQRRTRKRKP